jgi:Cdc6-like AAA superfamily ATPase
MTFNPYEEVNIYFNFHQRVVILNILKIAKSQKKKTIDGDEVFINYLKMCKKYDIEPVFKTGFLYALKAFEVAGFIKVKEDLKITKLDLEPYTVDDWIEAIYQDPEFAKVKAGEASESH